MVDMRRSSPDLSIYLEHLRGLPGVLEVSVKPAPGKSVGVDGILVIETKGGPKKVPFQVKRSHLLRETAVAVVHQAQRTPKLLLMAPHIGHDLGQLFVSAKVNYVDLAGNWYINLDDQYIAHSQGKTIERVRLTEKGFRAASYRAIFALLVDPSLINESTRKIATQAGGLSPQTVTDVRNGLVERGLVLRSRKAFHWTPGKRTEVLDLWLAGFATTLWRTLRIAPLRSQLQDPRQLEREITPALNEMGAWRWGGGAAAQRLTDYYRGDKTLIYLLDAPPRDLSRRLRLVPDVHGNVVIARVPGPLAFVSPRDDTVHPLLVYADLLGEYNERASDAARFLRQKLLSDLENAP